MLWTVTILVALLGLLATIGLYVVSRPRSTGQSGDNLLHPVAPGLWIFRGYFSNAVVFELRDQVVLVDALSHRHVAAQLARAIDQQIGKPVTHLIATHFHGDHVGGAAEFPQAIFITTETTAHYITTRSHERKTYTEAFGLITPEVLPPIRTPDETFSGEHTLTLGDETLRLLQLGAVETDDACVVHWPARRAIACGDGVSTVGYPFLGAPIADEGLRDDGEWLGFLSRLAALEPEVLLPGHGIPLIGVARIHARLALLRALFTDILDATRDAMRTHDAVEDVLTAALPRLAPYDARADLKQNVTTQRFAIYRAYNSMRPERAGKGWWHDLRAPTLRPPDPACAPQTIDRIPNTEALLRQSRGLKDSNEVAALFEVWLRRHPEDVEARAALAAAMLSKVGASRSIVDDAEYFHAARDAARGVLDRAPDHPVGLAVLGILTVWSAIVLGAPTADGVEMLRRALRAEPLDRPMRQRVAFFIGKAHQFEHNAEESDRWLRRAMPPWSRTLFPLFRPLLRSIP
ncbi:MAG: MBL fold metallo-hydrolase [Myxococcota bacterium]